MYRNLEAEIVRKGLTQKKLADLINCNVSTLSLKLNGKREFTLDEAKKIKTVLNVDIPLDDLFSVFSGC